MNTKRITYLAATLALATAAASCEHEEIYEPLEFSVRLAPTNTYRTGDPVVFNFSGNADFITVWTGDTGHEYKHRNRTKVDIADIESCELEIEISQQYGTLNNLDLFAGNKFAGLNGSDAATDRPVVEAIAANDCADWTKLEFTPNNANKFKTYTYDITRFADRFSHLVQIQFKAGSKMLHKILYLRRIYFSYFFQYTLFSAGKLSIAQIKLFYALKISA